MPLVTKTSEVKLVEKGERGAKLRTRSWEIGFTCLEGKGTQDFYDVVLYKDLLYLCVKSHVSSLENNPQKSVADNLGFWEVAQDWTFVATKLLLAERINADIIDTDSLVSKQLLTGYGGARVEISGSEIKIFGNQAMNIRFGVNDDGMSVLEYYDNSGRKLYDIGPEGITKIPVTAESWTTYYYKFLGTNIDSIIGTSANRSQYKKVAFSSGYAVYQYHSKVVAGVVDDPVNNNKFFVEKNKNGAKIRDWWHVAAPSSSSSAGSNMQWQVSNETGQRFYPPGIRYNNEPVFERNPVYMVEIVRFTDGLLADTTVAYWNGGTGSIE